MSDPIMRLNAALEGRYEIDREIGEGGMATVYLARDLKHNRNVALKVLKPELAAVVGADRFLAEIETTANLQHPHILPLFDSGEADSFLFYVMPYIDGETLRDRLDREKQLPVDEAIGIATAVANALQTAHEAGVVHRDIKPGNILMSQGEPLVSDFGIALAVGAAGGNRLTETGLSVGTPYYMSPEQATGDQQIGPASDTYALACVLYEMLVGEPPYTGNTAQAVLGKILMGEPVSATAIRASIPANVDAAIRKALEKLPADRFTGAHGFARALGDTGFRHGAEAVAEGEGRETAGFWKPLAIAAGVLALIALAVAAREWTRPEPPGQPPLRAHFEMEGRTVAPVDHVAVSADGSMFAASFLDEGNGTLHIRNADEEVFRAVPGTENARGPTFSPQGDWIAFADNQTGSLLKVSIAGGAPRPVVTADVGAFQAFWGDDGTIVFWGDVDGVEGIYRVADTGGDPRLLLEVGPGMEPLNPRLLPGGDKLIATNGDSASTFLLDLDDGSATTLIEGGIGARYVETGHLVYADLAGGLWAVRFDPGAEAVSGEPVPVLEGVTVWFNRFPRFSVAGNGTLVYGRGGGGGATAGETRELVMIDMAGVEEVAPLTPRPFDDLFWSPDGSSIVYTSSVAEGRAVLTYNVDLGTTPQQITFDGEFNRAGPWSPDGTRVAFTSARSGTDGMDLFVKNVTDDSPPQMVFSAPGFQYPTDWPADDVLVFLNANGGSDNLWVMDPADSASARPYLEAEARLLDMRVSPGGDLAAYMSNETGFFQIYVRSFPEPRQPVLVSSGVGGRPRWSPSGDTLYYWRGGAVDTLYAASVRRQPTFAVESIEAVFTGQWEQGDTDLHPEGDRWISARAAGSGNAPGQVEPERFLVVTNWFEELRAALGEDDR